MMKKSVCVCDVQRQKKTKPQIVSEKLSYSFNT